MRTTRLLTMFALFSAALVIAAVTWTARGDGELKSAVARIGGKDHFIVHEWGTFTSFSGSDGVTLEFRPLIDVDLPRFVLDRGRQEGKLNPFLKYDYRVFQRMETPVTYFYSDREREARVRVGFPQGMLTEFYPPVERQLPEFNLFKPQPLTGAELDWGKVWIVPEDRLRVDLADAKLADLVRDRVLHRLLPNSDNYPHYAYARETDSALVYVERQATKERPLAPFGEFFEKFLFYRGVGNFELPLELSAAAGDRYELTNRGAEPIGSLFLVTVEAGKVRFARYAGIQPGERLTLDQSQHDSTVEALGEAVVAALIEEKLYEREARAMVKTWQSSWFGEEGTRLFYMLPQSVTDELLPLSIEPVPDETVRVMVGRLEIMRPEDEARVMGLVQQSVKDRAAASIEKRQAENSDPPCYKLSEEIIQLGRLAEPALVRVRNIAPDEAMRHEASQLLGELRQYRNSLAATAETSILDTK
jgi:hypothetical protein